jgi:hypothetical protein
MPKTKQKIFLDPRIRQSFAGVRGRVKAAVAAQPHSVSFSEALIQTRKFQISIVTSKSTGYRIGKLAFSTDGSVHVRTRNGLI